MIVEQTEFISLETCFTFFRKGEYIYNFKYTNVKSATV